MISKGTISNQSRIMFVNDGSKDKTWSIIKELHNKDSLFSGLNLSRNRGHQNALLAGLMTAKDLSDVTISLDADLQDDIHVIDRLLKNITMDMMLYMEFAVRVLKILGLKEIQHWHFIDFRRKWELIPFTIMQITD